MKLLTTEMREKLPKLYSQDGRGNNAIAYYKFFTPDANWTWYVFEGEAQYDDDGNEVNFLFFGYVIGLENELGYFSLNELKSVRGPFGLPIERDLYYDAENLEDIKTRGY